MIAELDAIDLGWWFVLGVLGLCVVCAVLLTLLDSMVAGWTWMRAKLARRRRARREKCRREVRLAGAVTAIRRAGSARGYRVHGKRTISPGGPAQTQR